MTSAVARVTAREVTLIADSVSLGGQLVMPEGARGLVLFAHGSGSSCHSPRNRFVAGKLCEACLGAVLFDLLTEFEGASRANVFDIEPLSKRLVAPVKNLDVPREQRFNHWARVQRMVPRRAGGLQRIGPAPQGLRVGRCGELPDARFALWMIADGLARPIQQQGDGPALHQPQARGDCRVAAEMMGEGLPVRLDWLELWLGAVVPAAPGR